MWTHREGVSRPKTILEYSGLTNHADAKRPLHVQRRSQLYTTTSDSPENLEVFFMRYNSIVNKYILFKCLLLNYRFCVPYTLLWFIRVEVTDLYCKTLYIVLLNLFATGNTPVCGWSFADNITVHVIPRKHFFTIS